jgi:hypothetical protein
MEALQWMVDHHLEVVAGFGYLVALASLVVKLTPTPKDDAVLAKVVATLQAFSLIKKHTAAEGSRKADER